MGRDIPIVYGAPGIVPMSAIPPAPGRRSPDDFGPSLAEHLLGLALGLLLILGFMGLLQIKRKSSASQVADCPAPDTVAVLAASCGDEAP